MTQITPVTKSSDSLRLFVEIKTDPLLLDSRIASGSGQDSFIFLYFQKDCLTEPN